MFTVESENRRRLKAHFPLTGSRQGHPNGKNDHMSEEGLTGKGKPDGTKVDRQLK